MTVDGNAFSPEDRGARSIEPLGAPNVRQLEQKV